MGVVEDALGASKLAAQAAGVREDYLRRIDPLRIHRTLVVIGCLGLVGAALLGMSKPESAHASNAVPASTSASAAASAENGTLPSDDYYIEVVRQRFGVVSTDDQLRALLSTSDWGPQIRVWVDLSVFGDTVLEPTKVGEEAHAAMMDHLVSSLGVRDLGLGDIENAFSDILNFTSVVGEASALNEIAINPLSVDGPLANFNYAHNVGSLQELYEKVSGAVGLASDVVGFASDVERYSEWGVEAITDRPWRELILQYRELRLAGSISDAKSSLSSDLVYSAYIDEMTRELTGSPYAQLFPFHSRFLSEDQMWSALESAFQAIQLSTDAETQSGRGALIDLLAYEQSANGMVAVQTSTNTIRVFNTGSSILTDVRLTANGSQFASAGTIARSSWVNVSDPNGNSLHGQGSISAKAGGMPAKSHSFESVRKKAWSAGITKTNSGNTYQFSANGFASDSSADVQASWSFGDGYSVLSSAGSHTFQCPGTYKARLSLRDVGSEIVGFPTTITIPGTPTFGWVMSGTGHSVAPGETASFSITGLPDDGTTRVTWNFGDGTPSVDGRQVDHTFIWPTVRSVTATVTKTATGCVTPAIQKLVSVGSQDSWVELPSLITADTTLSTAVGGYWARYPVIITADASLTIPGGVTIKSASDLLFDVRGELHLSDTHITSVGDQRTASPPDVYVAQNFRFNAINARAGATVDLDGVTVDYTDTVIQTTKARQILLRNSTIGGGSYGINATGFDQLIVSNTDFTDTNVPIKLLGSGDAEVVDCTFANAAVALYVTEYARVRSQNNSFTNVQNAALLSTRGITSTFTGSSVEGPGGLIGIWGSTPAGLTRLSADLPYSPSNVYVDPGTTLVIDAGVKMKLTGTSNWPTVGFSVAGRVVVQGSEDKPVIFTNRADDSVGGDTDGVSGPSSWADWYLMPFAIRGAGRIEADHVRQAGGSYFVAAAPGEAWAGGWGTYAGNGGSVLLTNSDITATSAVYANFSSSNFGLASIRIAKTTIHGSSGVQSVTPAGNTTIAIIDSDLRDSPISAKGERSLVISGSHIASVNADDIPSVVITGNTLHGAKSIRLGSQSIGATVRDNSFSDGIPGIVSLRGSITAGVTHLNSDQPYSPMNVDVGHGATLVLDAGVRVKMEGANYYPTEGFRNSGIVRVEGTATDPVTISSSADDTVGGDTDGRSAEGYSSSWLFTPFSLSGAGNFDIDHLNLLGGAYLVAAIPGDSWAGSWGTYAGNGGSIHVSNSNIKAQTPIVSGSSSTASNLASISIERSTFHESAAIRVSGGDGSTVVSVLDSDLRSSSVAVVGARNLTISGSQIASVTANDVRDVSVTDNVLHGAKSIYLTDRSIGAVVENNTTIDGIPGLVRLTGAVPAGETRLSSDQPYVPTNVYVGNNSTVVFDPGVMVKMEGSNSSVTEGFLVSGLARVEGTESSPVTFTSAADDSVGGDTDGRSAEGYASSWAFTPFSLAVAGKFDIEHARALGGAYFIAAVPGASWTGTWGTNATSGGVIAIRDSDIAASSPIVAGSSSTVSNLSSIAIERSIFHDSTAIRVSGGDGSTVVSIVDSDLRSSGVAIAGARSLSVQGSKIASVVAQDVLMVSVTDNVLYGTEYIYLTDRSIGATVRDNESVDGIPGVIRVTGFLQDGTTRLGSDIPYSPANVVVGGDATLVFEAGAMVKIVGSTFTTEIGFVVAGRVQVEGSASEPVVFTSSADDSVGGNTDGVDGTHWSNWSYVPFGIANSGVVDVNRARVLGGAFFVAATRAGGWGSWSTNVGSGGSIRVRNSDISTSNAAIRVGTSDAPVSLSSVVVRDSVLRTTGLEVRQLGETLLTVEGNDFVGLNTAVAVSGTVRSDASISLNNFAGSVTGVSSQEALTASRNWWGQSNGPGHPFASASSLVRASPWCLEVECTTFSAAPPTSISAVDQSPIVATAGALVNSRGFVLHIAGDGAVEPTDVDIELSGALLFEDGSSTATISAPSSGIVNLPDIRASTSAGTGHITARALDFEASIDVVVAGATPASLVDFDGGGVDVEPGATVAGFSVRVVDQYKNPVAGVGVAFDLRGAGEFVTGGLSATVNSGSTGVATSPSIVVGDGGHVEVTASVETLILAYPHLTILNPSSVLDGLVINEIFIGETSGTDWIELYNNGTHAVDVGGLVFTHAQDPASTFTIPAALSVERGGFLAIDLDRAVFTLAASDSVELHDGTTLLDSHGWASAATTSVGRCPDGVGEFKITSQQTKSAANSCSDTSVELVFTSTSAPVVRQRPTVGVRLTAVVKNWVPTPDLLTYQWYRGDSPVAGATKSSYTVSVADAGEKIAVTVSGSKAGYTTASSTSILSDSVPLQAFTSRPAPVILGRVQVGSNLTAQAGTWSPVPDTFTYSWYRGASKIKGATGVKYAVGLADVGMRITVRVVANKVGHRELTSTSLPTISVPAPVIQTPRPTISGDARVGRTLTAEVGSLGQDGSHLRYQWYRADQLIFGAEKPTYLLTQSDKGRKMSVVVTGTKSGYPTTRLQSLLTTVVE